MRSKYRHARWSSGETIVEVLLAIAIAAFAIGTSYALAHKSLQQAIASRERNEAVNMLENQITALKFRQQQTDTATFLTQYSATGPLPANFKHFCLNENATTPSDPVHPWAPYTNPNPVGTDSTGYAAECVKTSSTSYYVDIYAKQTLESQGSNPPTVYEISVNWDPIGSGQANRASIFYRF